MVWKKKKRVMRICRIFRFFRPLSSIGWPVLFFLLFPATIDIFRDGEGYLRQRPIHHLRAFFSVPFDVVYARVHTGFLRRRFFFDVLVI